MDEILLKIRRDISEGFTEEALNKAISLAKKNGYKSQLNHLTILSSQFQNHQREYLGGLTTDTTTKNRIDLAVLSIIDSIERINKPISNSKKKEEFVGKIIYLNNEQNFGFIRATDLANEIFFHFSAVKGRTPPRIRQKVIFELDKNMKGWYAPRMKLIQPPKKRKRLTKKQSQVRTKELKKKMFENDIKVFFKRIENTIIKIFNKFF